MSMQYSWCGWCGCGTASMPLDSCAPAAHLLVAALGVEGQVAAHHGKQHDAQAPHIHWRAIVRLQNHAGSSSTVRSV